MKIEPWPFSKLFASKTPVEIPLFQRKYVWTEEQGKRWFRDAVASRQSSHSSHGHRVGKVTFKERPASPGVRGSLICIDGQQRITTISLLCAAVRDKCLGELAAEQQHSQQLLATATSVCSELNRALFLDPEAAKKWVQDCVRDTPVDSRQQEIFVGKAPDFLRLQPSYADRGAYLELVVMGLHPNALHLGLSTSAQSSLQGQMKAYFGQALEQFLSESGKTTCASRVNALSALGHRLTSGMSMMYCEILTPINLAQVFLWMQEKSLFGMGALLFNPSPGLDFQSFDLVRNLLMAPIMNEPLAVQEDYHFRWWLQPIELALEALPPGSLPAQSASIPLALAGQGPDHKRQGKDEARTTPSAMTTFLSAYVNARYNEPGRHIGGFETTVLQITKAVPGGSSAAILLYSRFQSGYEHIRKQIQQADSSATTEALELRTCETVLKDMASFVQHCSAATRN